MISDENIAAAQIAQIFGSELLKAQQSARTDSGSVPDFVKMNPKQFLVNENSKTSSQRQLEEQRLIQMLQREAESACPLPEPSFVEASSSPALPTHTSQIPNSQSSPLVTVGNISSSLAAPVKSLIDNDPAINRIADSLERIANSLESVDILVKKRKIKRNKPQLNESNSK